MYGFLLKPGMSCIPRINTSVRTILLHLLFFAAVAYPMDYDWNALGQGHVIIDYVEDEHDVPGVRATFLVKAEREDIWATLLDYENFPQIFEGINRVEVLYEAENGARFELWVDATLSDVNFVLYRDYIEPGHKLTWKRVSGDMKDIHGSWQILDTPDSESKLLIYESFVDFGFSVVTWMISIGAKQKTEKMAYSLREWIEQMEY